MVCEPTLRSSSFYLISIFSKEKGADQAPCNMVELFCESVHSKREPVSL
jgi:hypothetical protein